MRSILQPHPAAAYEAVRALEVEALRTGPVRLTLRYRVEGRVADLLIPPPAPPARTDELWRHTCFEAFLKAPDGEAYLEINLAPSGQWAAYLFDGYREGMRDAPLAAAPVIQFHATDDALDLSADLDLTGLVPPDAPWQAGLTAVVEETGGRTSHWALAHPPGRADFHYLDGFALTLPSPA